jgi:hypothetical protein
MSALPPTNHGTPYCFRCEHRPGLNGPILKRCGACCSRHYCSTECQLKDWPKLIIECPIFQASGEAPAHVRQNTATARDAFAIGAIDIDPDMISYLKTSKPHLKDVSISGLFYSLQTIFGQMLMRLRIEGSTEGEANLDRIV